MKTKTLLMLLAAAMSFTACDSEDDTKGDLTASIIGHYVNASTDTDITVNKIDDTHVSIQLTTGNGSSQFSVAFTSVTMNSATAFTLNTVTGDDYCGDQTYSGTGTHSGDNISLFMTLEGGCPGTESVSATRV